jgi:hypothetical protein
MDRVIDEEEIEIETLCVFETNSIQDLGHRSNGSVYNKYYTPYAHLLAFLLSRIVLLQLPVRLIRGRNLDFSLCTIPTVGRYEKYGVFRKHRTLVAAYCRNRLVLDFLDFFGRPLDRPLGHEM